MTDDQPTVTLRHGTRMPMLGLGVWQIPAGRATEQAVTWALEAGYRHIDTAAVYRNEQSVGAAVLRSGLPRDEVFVTTKLFPTHPSAERELDRSLTRLGLDYVDLYLLHWPFPLRTVRLWRRLDALRERGLAREVGVSNFGRDRLGRLRHLPVPAVDQVQFSPFKFRRRLLEHCREHGIVLEAYSPLDRGGGLADPTVVAIAERVGRTPAQVLLRFAVQHGVVVIPKSQTRERIVANARIFDFELSAADMAALEALDRTGGAARARP